MASDTTGAASRDRATRPGALVERAIAGAVAAVAVGLAVRFFVHAGPLWRDEIDAVNLSKLAPRDLWAAVDRIGLLPAYPAFLRLWGSLGWQDEDTAMRMLGLLVAVATFAALWIVGAHLSGQPPALALALYGTNAIAVQASTSPLVYAPGILLVVTTFGSMWALATTPRAAVFVATTCAAVAAVQLQYLNLVHVGAMAVAAAAVSVMAGRWRGAALASAAAGIPALSLLPYREAVSRSMTWRAVSRNPLETTNPLSRVADVLSFGSAAMLVVWLGIAALAVYGLVRLGTARGTVSPGTRERVVYGTVVVALAAVVVLGAFALAGPVIMPRHLAALFAMLALTVDAIVARTLPRWTRLVAAGAVVAVALPVSSDQLGVRATNVDLVSRHLEREARSGDLIVVNPWFVATTFDRYYHGKAAWTSLPPLADFTHQRYDLLRERMQSADPLAPLFAAIARTLEGGGRVWFVGPPAFLPPGQPVPVLPPAPRSPTQWFDVPYVVTWSMQTGDFVRQHALRWYQVPIAIDRPVSPVENPSVLMVEGWAK